MTEKHFDINEDGYSIRCLFYFGKDQHAVTDYVIATYGFGGNKENHPVRTFAERLISKYKHFGVICFDWPCHGADARNKLILSECMTYFDLVIRYVRNEWKAERIYTYGTSFGGYITLKYLAEEGNPFEKIALRCPAINMYDIMASRISDDEWNKLNRGKEILRGYTRKIKITREFLEELKAGDLTKYEYFDYADAILILQGTKDEFVSMDVVRKFCDDNVIELISVENADHPFSDPHIMDLAISKIIDFFHPETL